MDPQILESLAEMICGDNTNEYPVYRSGSELTRFFQRVGFSNFVHDGSTRKWWTLEVLKQLSDNNLKAVIMRLANPAEYKGKRDQIEKGIKKLNEILMVCGWQVELTGVNPRLKEIVPQIPEVEEIPSLKPLPPPDFLTLKLDPGLGEILSARWNEIQKCMDAEAYLASIILMGSMLEGIILAILLKYPSEANQSAVAPKNNQSGKVKAFTDWSLSDMINVAHDLRWLDLDVQKFSHSLREFRNLIHPYEQLCSHTSPDKDTCGISWLVVQAATNDLARKLR
jgi:hypothetical protein